MSPTLADGLVVAAWIAVAVVDATALAREREARTRLGPALAGGRRPPRIVLVLLVALAAGGFVVLERGGPRLALPPLATLAGLALTAAGLALHAVARGTLGASWSGIITVRAGQTLVERGPYRVIRHPLYASFLLLAAGAPLVHPSLAVACAALGCGVGIALKIVLEERVLRRTLGESYRRYAASVPALVPRFRRRPRAASETDCPGA